MMTNPKNVRSNAARRQGERDSGATDVAGRTDFQDFKKKRRARRPWLTPEWRWRSSANADPAGWKTIRHHVQL